jgi:hypothetical protein
MKRHLDTKFFEAFVIFFIIQPVIFFLAMAVFICAIIESIWGTL